MADRIKLENLGGLGYNTETGEPRLSLSVEYTCGNCRFLAKDTDKFCHNCGEELEDKGLVEHYVPEGQLGHKDFVEAMKMNSREAVEYIKRHTKKEG